MTTTAAAPPPARTLSDLLLGLLGGGMLLLALALLVAGGETDGGGAAPAPPAVTVVEPATGAVLRGPLQIVFRTPADLGPMPMGWGTGELHLHILLDGQQFMPSAADIKRQQDGSYRWGLGRLGAGEHRFRLFWSDATHRPIAAGGSDEVVVHVP